MTIDFQVDVAGPDLAVFMDDLAKQFPEEAERIAIAIADVAAQNIRAQANAKLTKDSTGELRDSVVKRILKTSKGRIEIWVGPTVIYAAIQNWGGVIEPVMVTKLAVPLSFAQVPKGLWPRDWPGKLNVIPRIGKDALLAVVGKGVFEPKYVLKSEVVIPATLYLNEAARETETDGEDIMFSGLIRWFDKMETKAGAV